jgi:predicted secreted protein
MAATDGPRPSKNTVVKKPSEEFSAYCEAEFERRLNSGEAFDEAQYRKAMSMVLDRLIRMEGEGRS